MNYQKYIKHIEKMDKKNKKVMLYLIKAIIGLNNKCNNVIREEKFKRAIALFINRPEDFETIKTIIDWHVQNETRQYLESLKAKKEFIRRHNHTVQYNNQSNNKIKKKVNKIL